MEDEERASDPAQVAKTRAWLKRWRKKRHEERERDTKETAADEVEFILRRCAPNTCAVVCATDADREALLAELPRRVEAAGHHMMTVAPPVDDDEAGREMNDAVAGLTQTGNVLLVVDRADELLPANGEPGQQSLFYWDTQTWYPVVLLMLGGDRLFRVMGLADLNRHCGQPLYWP